MKNFDTFAFMVDCSRNGVLNVESVKRLIRLLKKMDYNALMLYTEDTYEVDKEPYFGYLRGRYSVSDLKEIDEYAKEHGIELIPCIQTLAHLNQIFRHEDYSSINDINDILLVDDERTYQLIDNMFSSLEKEFTSRRVHIGMDEAHLLGLGKYKELHGYQDRTDIFIRHLNKVNEIAKKHGFSVMMWSDMFFRLASNNSSYYNVDAKMDLNKLKDVPKDVLQVYWDYYHNDKNIYDKMISLHKEINSNSLYFASGVWTWAGFAPLLSKAEETIAPGIRSCIDNKVRNVIMTGWGDNGAECSMFSSVTSLFFASEIAKGINDINKIKEDFFNVLGYKYDDLKLLEIPNQITNPGEGDDPKLVNPCKYFLYNDPLLGIFDNRVDLNDEILFEKHAKKLNEVSFRCGEYKYIFDYLASLCHLLSIKVSLGVRIREAYQKGDKEELKNLLPRIEECINRISDFSTQYRKRWIIDNKPIGMEVGQLRLGGLKARLEETRRVVIAYTNGTIDRIEELREKILPLIKKETNPKSAICYNCYNSNVSNNIL